MKRSPRISLSIVIMILFSLAVFSACNLSPMRSYAPTETVAGFMLPTAIPTRTPTPLPTPTALPSEEDCTDIMQFVNDVNLEDGFEVHPGEVVDKQWQVKNDGTCNWGPGYTLRVTDADDELGLKESYDLYPALSGTELTLRLVFVAPEEEGEYSFRLDPFNLNGDRFDYYISSSFFVVSVTE